jgi:putative hydrolase of the HAD superfamily
MKAIFVDAVGTLIHPREPVGITYARAARAHGVDADPVEVAGRLGGALAAARSRGLRQRGDGREFWRAVVAEAVGVDHAPLSEALYQHYAQPRAWWVDTEALQVLSMHARAGRRLGIVSNFDRRLRSLYERFALDRMFGILVCSAEIGVEKPDPLPWQVACRAAGVAPRDAVHVGDREDDDVEGATRAGLRALRFDAELGWRAIGTQLAVLGRRMPGFGA